jgi:uncharacterized protein (DUF1499 family)
LKRRTAVALLATALAGVGIGMLFGIRGAWFTQNDVTTGENPAYPELTSHSYRHPPSLVFDAARRAAASIRRWKVVAADDQARELRVEVRTALFWFTDDLAVRVETAGEGSRVVIRSRSRVGRGDLGENARHIAALQQEMDRELR